MFQTTNQIKKDALDGGQSNGRASGETCLILCGLAMHIDFTSVHFLKKKKPRVMANQSQIRTPNLVLVGGIPTPLQNDGVRQLG